MLYRIVLLMVLNEALKNNFNAFLNSIYNSTTWSIKKYFNAMVNNIYNSIKQSIKIINAL